MWAHHNTIFHEASGRNPLIYWPDNRVVAASEEELTELKKTDEIAGMWENYMRSFMAYTFHRALIQWYNGGGRDGHGYGACMLDRNGYIILVTIAD